MKAFRGLNEKQLPPGAAISIWGRRESTNARGTARLKEHNQEFQLLCDSVSQFASGATYESVLAVGAICLSDGVQKLVSDSFGFVFSAVDSLHQGTAKSAASVVAHVSRVGRLNFVWLQIVGVYHGEKLLEFLTIEYKLPDFNAAVVQQVPEELSPPLGSIIISSSNSSISSISNSSDSNSSNSVCSTTSSSKQKEQKRQWTLVRCADFQSNADDTLTEACVSCFATKTPQRRVGPDGKKNLCNRCGLKWRREAKNKKS